MIYLFLPNLKYDDNKNIIIIKGISTDQKHFLSIS